MPDVSKHNFVDQYTHTHAPAGERAASAVDRGGDIQRRLAQYDSSHGVLWTRGWSTSDFQNRQDILRRHSQNIAIATLIRNFVSRTTVVRRQETQQFSNVRYQFAVMMYISNSATH